MKIEITTMRTGTALAKTAPKITTHIPPDITTPDSVATRLGTLKFFDGLPDKDTVEKVYDNLDLHARRGRVPEHDGGSVHSGQYRGLEERRLQPSDGRDPRESRRRCC
jgi:hypothetical protein